MLPSIVAQVAAAALLPKLLPLTGLGAVTLLGWRQWQRSQKSKHLQDLPGPKRHWLLGNIPQILGAVKQKTYFKLMADWSQEYGSVFICWINKVPMLILSQPEAIERTIVNGMRDGSLIRSQRSVHAWNDISGPILIGQSGEAWQWRRKAWNPEFSVVGLSSYLGMVHGACSQATETVRAAGPDIVKADPLFVELTMRVISCLMLGIPVERDAVTPEGPPLDIEKVYNAMAVMSYRFLRVATGEKSWQKYLPTQNSKDYWAARNDIESMLAPRVDLALQLRDSVEIPDGQTSELFRNCMLVKIAAKEPRYGKKDLIAEAIELLIAGTDTTAHTLSYAMAELALHPEVGAKARAVVDAAWEKHGELGQEALKELNYIRAVVKETLRLYSVASGSTPLETVRETEVEGIRLPAGSRIFWSMIAAGRDSETYDDPNTFRPERWLKEGNGKGSPSLPVVQFGSGFHRCLGEHLAMLEATVMLAQLLREFDWELVNGRASLENLKQNLLVYPEDEMPLRFRKR